MARTWSGCGARCCRCPRIASGCSTAARSSDPFAWPTRPDTPPTTSPTCTSRADCAFTGDVTGVRIGAGPVMAPTPPARHRSDGLACVARGDRGLAPGEPRADALRRLRRRRGTPGRPARSARPRGGDGPRASIRRASPRRSVPGGRNRRRRDGRRIRAGDAPGPDLSGPRRATWSGASRHPEGA